MAGKGKDVVWNKETLKQYLGEDDETLQMISIDPEIMDGLPVIKGTRIPVYVIMEHIESGWDAKRIIEQYPSLTEKAVKSAIHFASVATSLH